MLIHGFPTASWDWEALWPDLTRRFRVYTLDLIGFGLSAKPADYAYSLGDQADLVEFFLTGEGVARYHVLAHDYGDTVAQELLARRREPGSRPTLLSVAFLNGGLFPETHRPVLIQQLLLSPLGLVDRQANEPRTAGAEHARDLRAGDTARRGADRQLLGVADQERGARGHAQADRYMVERRECRARWVGALQDARIPLTLIDGAADPVSGAHMAARYRELVPRADVTLLDGIGHYPQIEAAGAVLAHYLAFRDRVARVPVSPT